MNDKTMLIIGVVVLLVIFMSNQPTTTNDTNSVSAVSEVQAIAEPGIQIEPKDKPTQGSFVELTG